MSDVKNNIRIVRESLPEGVKLVAVSKTKPVDIIQEAYDEGQRVFGENKVQELLSKKDLLPPDVEWHLIGHLQTNKVRQIIPYVSLIHSVDSFKLLKAIDDNARKMSLMVDCLLQFHIATEETKFGFSLQEAEEMLSSESFRLLKNVRIRGVMGMASFTDDDKQIISEFKTLKSYFNTLKNNYFKTDSLFKEISMGMSDDYLLAVEEGSTMVRVGSKIFGERQYQK